MKARFLSTRFFLPRARKQRHEMKYRSTECLNCQHPLDLSDQYCPNCSQLNSTKKLAFDDFFNEFFAGVLAYDSRLYRTLGALLFRPGKISRDYIEGKRVRYANPYRFYLSASIIFFLVWTVPQDFNGTAQDDPEQIAAAKAALSEERANNAVLDSVLRKGGLLPATESTWHVPESEIDTLNFFVRAYRKISVFSAHYGKESVTNPVLALQQLGYDTTRFNLWLYEKTVDAHAFLRNPELFISYFVGKLPFIIFFFLPVFALFVWLLYLRRPFTYMEHLIFTFHNQTTWFVLFGIVLILDYVFNTGWFTVIGILAFIWYLYRAFRTFYKQGIVKTTLKFAVINIIFFILAVIGTAVSVVASFAIY